MGLRRRRSLVFQAPRTVSVETSEPPPPGAGELAIEVVVSAISAGTELLIYRGDAPSDGPLDETIPALTGDFSFPLRYGYAAAGRVAAAGESVDPSWVGRRVFLFHPHDSHALARPEDVLPLPDGVSFEAANFIPTLETAVNLVMDGSPLLGERVVVFGQGVVGLLTTALLARFPLETLITLDVYAGRRSRSRCLGAYATLDPTEARASRRLTEMLAAGGGPQGADLVYELSGNPDALNMAISATGFSGRIVVGSWYGRKRAPIDLGGHFHRGRIRLVSSQVSTIAPELRGRWDKARRFRTVLSMLSAIDVERLISHRFPIERAADAYALLDRAPEGVEQVVLTYQE